MAANVYPVLFAVVSVFAVFMIALAYGATRTRGTVLLPKRG